MEMIEFDASRYLRDENECRLYLADMMKDGSPVEIQKAIADVVRASKADVHAAVQEQLAGGTADFATVVLVLGVLGLSLTVKKKPKK
jgi:DNA-binding phage protein